MLKKERFTARLHQQSSASAILEISGPGRNMHQGLLPKVGGLNLSKAVQAADVVLQLLATHLPISILP